MELKNVSLKIKIVYVIGISIISLIPLIAAVFFIDSIFKFAIIVGSILLLGLIWFLLWVASDGIFDIILTDRYKKKNKIHWVRWKSKEFDNFVGDKLIDLYEDNVNIFMDYTQEGRSVSGMSDYSFMLLPIAKVYEGVLKEVLSRIGLTKAADWESNPNLSVSKYFNPVGNEKIFEALEDKARDKSVPHIIYSTYQECRNKIFHYDAYRDNRIKTLEDAEFYKKRIEHAIEKAYETFIKK